MGDEAGSATSGVDADRIDAGRTSDDVGWSAAQWVVLFAAFAGVCLAIYQPALRGPLISDDFGYLTSPYTRSLAPASLAALFDPFGDARLYTGNYSPLHHVAHAVERAVFGRETLGYHVVNVLVHALAAVLLVALLVRSGVERCWALLGGAWFALHPAAVEAVAWISQLKTNGALALSLAALLCFGRAPVAASLLFAAALLFKASAGYALPMAAALWWVRRESAPPRARNGATLIVWASLFALYAIPQFAAFQHIGEAEVDAFDESSVQLRTVAAVGMRYLVMAATGIGVSAFQEPPPVASWLDPWWLAACPAALWLGWRAVASMVAGREEGAWWVAAAASFAPVSQLFPFLIPVADRYLYFILPFLIGGVLLASKGARQASGAVARVAVPAAGVVAVALCVVFGVRSHERAKLWRNETFLLVDAAAHYPDGGTAYYLRARRAAQEGDAGAAVEALFAAADRGVDRFDTIRRDQAFAGLRDDPAFEALLFDLAGRWIERAPSLEDATQPELIALARAHVARGEVCDAQAALQAAVERGGPVETAARQDLEALQTRGATAKCAQ